MTCAWSWASRTWRSEAAAAASRTPDLSTRIAKLSAADCASRGLPASRWRRTSANACCAASHSSHPAVVEAEKVQPLPAFFEVHDPRLALLELKPQLGEDRRER